MKLSNTIIEDNNNSNEHKNLQSNIKLPDKYPDLSYEK